MSMQEMAQLLERNLEHVERFGDRFEELQDSQHPDFVTVCCSDSRVLQDEVWGNSEPGRLFTCSNIGNRVVQREGGRSFVSGDVLYPIEHTATRNAVVLGHTGCGAVTAAYHAVREGLDEPEGIERCIETVAGGIEDRVDELPGELEEPEAVNRLVEHNVDAQVTHLLESPDVPEEVRIVGAVYDFQDVYSGERGRVHVINVDGETETGRLRSEHPEISDRINRLTE